MSTNDEFYTKSVLGKLAVSGRMQGLALVRLGSDKTWFEAPAYGKSLEDKKLLSEVIRKVKYKLIFN